jgi:hypothetical protein
MSPILDLQRRFAEVGRIRAGAKGAKGQPQKLDAWRLTSANRQALDAAAGLYGGDVRPWQGASTPGQFELFTETRTLDVMVPPSQEPYSAWYEQWSGGGCERRCDGVRDHLNDQPCSCDAANRACKPTLRVSLALHRIPGLGVWRYESHGFYAATELPATLDLLAAAASRGQYLTGFLRLEERATKTKANGTRRFMVPVLDLEQTIGELAGISVPSARELVNPAPAAVEATNGARLPAAGALPASEMREITETDYSAKPVADAEAKRMIWVSAQNIGLTKNDLDDMLAELRGADTADMGTITADEVPVIVGLIEVQERTR